MSASQWFLAVCLMASALIYLAAWAIPRHLRAVRRWFDLVDAVEQVDPSLAQQYRDHPPMFIRPWRRWVDAA